MTPSSRLREESDGFESTSKLTVVHSDRRSPATLTEKMPSESEIEEFFAAAEKDIQTRFAKKYEIEENLSQFYFLIEIQI